MNRTAQHRRGVIIIELAASLGLMGLLAVVLGSMMVSYQRADAYYMTQRRLQLAVEGQMEAFRAASATGGLPDTGSTITAPGNVMLTIHHRPGVGEWNGLVFVEIRASTEAWKGRTVTAIIRAYLPPEMSP